MQYLKGNAFIADFAERTLKNIESSEQNSPYEITLLMNSLYGLLVVPEQRGYEKLNFIKLDSEIYNSFCKSIKSPQKTSAGVMDLQVLMRHMRNAIAHVNLEFGSEDGKLSKIKMYDGIGCKSCKQCKTVGGKAYLFYIDVKIVDLRKFVIEFAKKAVEYWKNKPSQALKKEAQK